MSTEMRRLAAEIAGIKNEVRAASTTQQLANSSVADGGNIIVYDSQGREVMTIGGSPDGSYGSNVRIGPVPPTPNAPTLIPTPAGMTIRWDGLYTDSIMTPDDFSRVEVFLGETTPLDMQSAMNLVGTIESPRGGEVVVTKLRAKALYHVGLVARNTAGGRGQGSVVASATSGGR